MIKILMLSEFKLKPSNHSQEIALSDYTLYRNDRLHKGAGGVAMYVKTSNHCKLLCRSEFKNVTKPKYIIVKVMWHCNPPEIMLLTSKNRNLSAFKAEFKNVAKPEYILLK